eukprot:1158182-Pelagomonas_calceolata.AAC.1
MRDPSLHLSSALHTYSCAVATSCSHPQAPAASRLVHPRKVSEVADGGGGQPSKQSGLQQRNSGVRGGFVSGMRSIWWPRSGRAGGDQSTC